MRGEWIADKTVHVEACRFSVINWCNTRMKQPRSRDSNIVFGFVISNFLWACIMLLQIELGQTTRWHLALLAQQIINSQGVANLPAAARLSGGETGQ
jgi:hypothetical protein